MVGAVGWANKQLPITDDMQPAVLRNLIVQCFKEPQERPSFSDIIGILKPLLDVKHLHPTPPPPPATAEAAPAAAGARALAEATLAVLQDPQQQASVAPAASPFGGQEQQDWVPASGPPQRQPGAGAALGPVPAAAASPFGGQEQQDWVPPGSAQGTQMPGSQPPPAPASPFGSREQQEQGGPRPSPAPPASLSGDSQQQQRPSPAVRSFFGDPQQQRQRPPPAVRSFYGDSQQQQQRAPPAVASPLTDGVQQDAVSDGSAAAQQTPARQWAASPFADEAQQGRLPPPGTQKGGPGARRQRERVLPEAAPTAGGPSPGQCFRPRPE